MPGIFAPAKVNLTLHVTGQREDGYHLLDSLVLFADVGDQLELSEGPELSLEVSGPFAAGVPTDRQNLVWRAALLAGWTGHIHLIKQLPHGGGIGGGSSDAAALLRAVAPTINGGSLGADVPVCQVGRATQMRGIGDQLDPVSMAPDLPAILVGPGIGVPTADVFRRLTTKDNSPAERMPQPDASPEDWIEWMSRQRNDLEPAAIACAPVIEDVLAALRTTKGCRLARMSGSGSTCFGLYPSMDAAHLAAARLRSDRPTWWSVATRLN